MNDMQMRKAITPFNYLSNKKSIRDKTLEKSVSGEMLIFCEHKFALFQVSKKIKSFNL